MNYQNNAEKIFKNKLIPLQKEIEDLIYSFKDEYGLNFPIIEPVNIEKELEREKKLDNDNKESDIKLKIKTLNFLLIILITETFLIFLLSFFQGFSLKHFYLEEWSFRLLVSSTIIHIYFMLRIAVQYLFPKK